MKHVQYLAIELMDASRPGREPLAQGLGRSPWSADASSADSERIERRNRDIADRLARALPGLAAARDAYDELPDYTDEGLSQEQVLRRYQRSRVLAGPWRAGELVIRVYDEVSLLSVPVVDLDARGRAELVRDLECLLESVTQATGMRFLDPDSGAVLGVPQAVAALLVREGPRLRRLARAVAQDRWRRRLGLPSLAVLTVLAFALALWLGDYGVRRGTLMAGVDRGSGTTFLTQSLPEPGRILGIFPSFALDGRIAGTGERVRLPVSREEYLRAGPAAPYTVLATGDPDTPYVLRSAAGAAGPILRLGTVGITWVAWLALLPLAFWYIWVLRPVLRAPPGRRWEELARLPRRLALLLQVLAAFLAIAWLKTS